ncbi:taste receptor type 2 member 104-like [Protopterus annectens]|uniref:taste receptor type 2 member 104-like n=1 Tax=Protopterus annectens TaxID=7888 RepID=UPI001CFA170C|nr:taste receptor type 2 member 104-like [Protopterus annectens]
MVTVETIIFMSAQSLLSFLALVQNIYILVVNCIDGRAKGNVKPTDLLMVGISACNVLSELLKFPWSIVYKLELCDIVGMVFHKVVVFFGMSMSTFNFWLTAWLCLVYFVKIVHKTNGPIHWLRKHLPSRVPQLIIGSLILNAALGVTMEVDTRVKVLDNVTMNDTTLCNKYVLPAGRVCTIIYAVFGCFLPFLLMVTSSVSLVKSLCQHAHRMEHKSSESGTGNSSKHIRVARAILIHTFLFSSGVIMMIVLIFVSSEGNWLVMLIFGSSIYAGSSALLLIITTTKLKKRCIEHHCCCCMSQPDS